MQWKSIYEKRLCSGEEAVTQIASGDRVVLGSACGTPEDLIDAMLTRAGELRDVELVAMVSTGKSAVRPAPVREGRSGTTRSSSPPSTRKAVDEDRADYSPCNFGDVPALMSDGDLAVRRRDDHGDAARQGRKLQPGRSR